MGTPKDIREVILNAIETDDSFTINDETRLIRKFVSASKEEREVIDYIFVQLCGYSLTTLGQVRCKNETTDNK